MGDHLAGARAATELATRCADGSRDHPVEPYLRRFLDELDEEKKLLHRAMDRLEVTPSLAKQAVGLAGAMAGIVREAIPGSYTPVNRLEDVEALCVGVWGKRLLWSSLMKASTADERLADLPFDRKADRAEDQERELLRWRDRVAAEALGTGTR